MKEETAKEFIERMTKEALEKIHKDFEELWAADHEYWMYRATGDKKYLK